METTPHGGYCCGMRHLYGFGSAAPTTETLSDLDEKLQLFDDNQSEGVIEAVLAEAPPDWKPWCSCSECRDPVRQNTNWKEALEARGFKEVTVSKNSKSGNFLHIYHRATG